MRTVTSKDGTPIACFTSGRGPPLVLVHGTSADHTRWQSILPKLEERFAVHAIDRRGRGASGDAPGYAIEREFEDVVAVVDSIGEPVRLLGHSYGAVCALEAALRTPNVGKLALYEPPLATEGSIYPPGVIDRLKAILARGDRDGVVTTFFREVVGTPPDELTMLRSLPSWPARVAAAHTIPRELCMDGHPFQAARFASLHTPTVVLLGGDSPPFFGKAAAAVHAALPASRIVVLPGQKHVAMNTAPDLFLGEVVGFLSG